MARGVRIHADVDASPRTRIGGAAPSIAGGSGIALALQMLLYPDEAVSVRDAARRIGLHASSVSRALARLRQDALATSDGRAVLPNLFWELASVWPTSAVTLRREPAPGDDPDGRLGINSAQLDQPGWVLCGTRAALAWDAPVIANLLQPADFYVPTPAIERRARQWFGETDAGSPTSTTVRIAPAAAVVQSRWAREGELWPVVHPTVVALDLAQDRGRGRQILEGWQPPDGFTRVW
jgi:hypothetical protein